MSKTIRFFYRTESDHELFYLMSLDSIFYSAWDKKRVYWIECFRGWNRKDAFLYSRTQHKGFFCRSIWMPLLHISIPPANFSKENRDISIRPKSFILFLKYLGQKMEKPSECAGSYVSLSSARWDMLDKITEDKESEPKKNVECFNKIDFPSEESIHTSASISLRNTLCKYPA